MDRWLMEKASPDLVIQTGEDSDSFVLLIGEHKSALVMATEVPDGSKGSKAG